MVRKIPVRKHRGVKDPLVQLARRNADSSINAAPSNPKEQELPKSVLEIQRLCELAKRRDEPRKKKKKNYDPDLIDSLQLYDKDPTLRGMRRKTKVMPRIIQRKGECDESFIDRFSAAAHDYIKEVELENKYDVNFDVDKHSVRDGGSQQNKNNSGSSGSEKNSSSRKRKQNFDPSSLNATKFNKRRRKGNLDAAEKVAKPNKQQRRKRRQLLVNKEEHYENELYDSEEETDFAILKDEVAFGEVVHRPPRFTAKPRGSELNSKPGTKDLLLKQMMDTSTEKGMKKTSNSKLLSNSQKFFLEKERLRVIQAYRDMKASKAKNK